MSTTPMRVVSSDPYGPTPRERKLLWTSMIGGLVFAGAAFCYKLAEFIFTLSSEDAKGFADVPVTVYFAVASGWMFLLLWCFATGKLRDHAHAKYEMLAKEEEYERLGQ